MRIRSNVTEQPTADAAAAAQHFADRLAFEADCADVYADQRAGVDTFVLVDTRSAVHYAEAHLPGAINVPHRRIDAALVESLALGDRIVVTYCAGPHCNASTRGALRFAALGVPVKEMPGGVVGWQHEGFPLETGSDDRNGPAAGTERVPSGATT